MLVWWVVVQHQFVIIRLSYLYDRIACTYDTISGKVLARMRHEEIAGALACKQSVESVTGRVFTLIEIDEKDKQSWEVHSLT